MYSNNYILYIKEDKNYKNYLYNNLYIYTYLYIFTN